jgi:hypothetical protein
MDAETNRKMLALKEELRRDLEAIERVERLMASKNGALGSDNRQRVLPIDLSVPAALGLHDEDEENQEDVPSLKGTIEATVNADLTVRWTNQKMLTHLKKVGFPLRAKKPIYSIGQAMQKLSDAGTIKLVRKGTGNQPNVYKGKAREQTPSTEAPSAIDQGGNSEMESRVVQ